MSLYFSDLITNAQFVILNEKQIMFDISDMFPQTNPGQSGKCGHCWLCVAFAPFILANF